MQVPFAEIARLNESVPVENRQLARGQGDQTRSSQRLQRPIGVNRGQPCRISDLFLRYREIEHGALA